LILGWMEYPKERTQRMDIAKAIQRYYDFETATLMLQTTDYPMALVYLIMLG